MLKTKTEIQAWLDKMGVNRYTIKDDLTVDVDNHVHLSNKKLSEIPVQFDNISGDFDIWSNNLISLKGCPIKVAGNFNCGSNNLKTLEYCPKIVGKEFNFNLNQINTLDYCPDSVGVFNCYINNFTTLKGFKIKINDHLNHRCDDLNQCIKEFEHLYEYVPHLYSYQLTLSAKQLNSIQQADELKVGLSISENKPSKKLKM
jgi:hypothetical protein